MDNTHSFTNLTPVSFLERCGKYLPDEVAIELPERKIPFSELLMRSRRMAEMLRSMGIEYGDRIGLLALNSQQSIEAHYAIPAAGGVIVSFNPWLSSNDIAKQIAYSGAGVILTSYAIFQQFRDILQDATKQLRLVILDSDGKEGSESAGYLNFEIDQHRYSSETSLDACIRSENDPIAINFTSGTTGDPKGVVYSHRAAYLHAIGQVLMLRLTATSTYFWSLPMFHVNGWGHMWAAVAAGAKQFVAGDVAGGLPEVFVGQVISTGATHLAGAPRLIRHLTDSKSTLTGLTVLTGGAAPTPDLTKAMEEQGIELIHQYGLNETLGPFVVCEPREQWTQLQQKERIKKRLRQGIAALHAGTGLRVVDEKMKDVPWDGLSLGEVVMSGNTVAQGYFNNPAATEKNFRDGWFHSGDVAVVHPDGYLEIKDRIKDLIFVETTYGWENISSIEIENVISQFPGIKDIAVVGINDPNRPTEIVAFFESSPNQSVDRLAIADYCAETLPSFKIPSYFFEHPLPKTATGKVKKNVLEVEARRQLEACA